MTVPVAAASSRTIRQSRAVQYRLASKRTRISRFQHFIESTDWDKKYLFHKGIDKICLGVIILSIIYFCFRPGAYLAAIVFRNYG